MYGLLNELTDSLGDATYYMGLADDHEPESWRSQLTLWIYVNLFGQDKLIASFLLSIVGPILLWSSVKRFIYDKYTYLWWLVLALPSMVVWTAIPSKEALVWPVAIFYAVIEGTNLARNDIDKWNNLRSLILRFSLLSLLYILRGVLVTPLFLIGITTTIFPLIRLKYKPLRTSQLGFSLIPIITLSLGFLIVTIVYLTNRFFIEWIDMVVTGSFLSLDANFSRYFLVDLGGFYQFSNFIRLPFLALFPTVSEVLNSPMKSMFILLDSFIFLFLYYITWTRALRKCSENTYLKRVLNIIFFGITFIYLTLFCVPGAFNVGTAQRHRVNFIPPGIVFPLAVISQLEKDKKFNYSILK